MFNSYAVHHLSFNTVKLSIQLGSRMVLVLLLRFVQSQAPQSYRRTRTGFISGWVLLRVTFTAVGVLLGGGCF